MGSYGVSFRRKKTQEEKESVVELRAKIAELVGSTGTISKVVTLVVGTPLEEVTIELSGFSKRSRDAIIAIIIASEL